MAPKRGRGPQAAPARAAAADTSADEDEPAAGVPQRESARKRTKLSYAEGEGGMLPSAAEQKELAEAVAARGFWEQWETPLCREWLADFPSYKLPKDATREAIIGTLVQRRAEFPQPKAAVAMKELQKVWKRRTRKSGTPPGRVADVAASAAADDLVLDDEMLGAAGPDDDAVDEEPEVAVFARPAPRAAPRPAPAAAAPLSLQPSPAPLAFDVSCHLCGAEAPPGKDASRPWRCAECGYRGDAAGARANEFLRLDKAASTPTSVASSSTSSSSGQSLASDSASALRGIDKTFDTLIRCNPESPFFKLDADRDEATAKSLVDSAFAEGMRSLDATSFEAPRPMLIKMIQAGKLVDVGWALPVPLTIKSRSEQAQDVYEMSSTGGLVPRAAAGEAPPLNSIGEFLRALVATVLPALVARPKATAQWLSLARSVSQIDASRGWPAARTYLTRVLHHRVLTAGSFSEVDAATVLSLQATAAPTFPAAGAHREREGQRAPVVCIDFNKGTCTRGERDCRYPHRCANSGKPGCDGDHAVGRCPLPPPHARFQATPRGSRGGSRGGRGGGDAGSVHSAKP